MSLPDRIKVHVLSDDRKIREATGGLPARFVTTFSEDRLEALRAIENEVDIAVIELDLGGFGIAKEVRERTPNRRVRIVMICSRPHDRWLCRQAGADEVLVKPLRDTSLLTRAIGA